MAARHRLLSMILRFVSVWPDLHYFSFLFLPCFFFFFLFNSVPLFRGIVSLLRGREGREKLSLGKLPDRGKFCTEKLPVERQKHR